MTRTIGAVVLTLATISAHAAFYDQTQELKRFSREIEYRLDPGPETTFESVSAMREGWVSQQPKLYSTEGKPVRLWARFNIRGTGTPTRYFILTGPWERVDYFFVHDGKLVARKLAGSLVPWNERTTDVTMVSPLVSGFVAVDAPADGMTVYARLVSDQRFVTIAGLRFSLWDENEVRSQERTDRLLEGVFLGIVALLILYNIGLYALDGRDVGYLYYVGVLACVGITWLAASGLGLELFWPAHPAWTYYILASPAVSIFLFVQFVRSYLRTKERLPAIDTQIRWIGIAVLLIPAAVLLLGNYLPILKLIEREAPIATVMVPLVGAITMLWVCGVALKNRLPGARLFAAAIGAAVAGATISALSLPLLLSGAQTAYLLYMHHLGVVIMGVLLTIGMGLRARDLRAELAAQRIEEARISGERHQLEIANKHKSEFLANMSHELRTPLNAIIGFSDVMLAGMSGPLSDKQKEFTRDIRDSGRHLLGLINDILDLSKIEAGRMELDVARFNLGAAMENAVTLVRERAERHGIRLDLEIAPEVGDYDGDERKFKQIMLNLLTNAVKFTPEGGTVTMSAGQINGSYVFRVSDTGIGIAPEDHGRIFEEFRQVGTDYQRKAEGTGLGLTLTKRLVELHGGSIRVESALGQGATFTFNLPLAQP